MSKPQHPYPDHVVEAMTLAYEDHWAIPETNSWACSCGNFSTPGGGGNAQHEVHKHITQVMLQALWDASRVDDIQQIDDLMPNTLLRTTDGYMWAGAVANKQDIDLLPAHVIHWGDSGE